MDTFIAGEVVWPPGWTKLHVYLIPDLDTIRHLVDVYRSVIETFPFIAPVPDRWLHATVQMIAHPAAGDVGLDQLTDVEVLLRQQIGRLAPFTLGVGGAVASRTGVVLDLTPDEEFMAIVHRCRAVVRDVFGEASVKYSRARPHITLGYARATGDSGVVQSKLRNATDERAMLTVADVSLVNVVQDPVRHQYRWTELARLPLEGATGSGAVGYTVDGPMVRRAVLAPVAVDAEPTR